MEKYKKIRGLALLLFLIAGASICGAASPQTGTNFLFIAIDDMRPVLGCYGDTKVISPNIDGLASKGVTFLNAHCQWSVCGPSRASMMTGLMPEETGVMGFKRMRGDAPREDRVNPIKRPNVVTIPQYFRYNGYQTAGTGKINDYRCVGTLDLVTLKVAEDGLNKDDPPCWGAPVNPTNLPADFFSKSAFVKAGGGHSGDGKSTTCIDAPDEEFEDASTCAKGITLMKDLAEGNAPFFLGVGFKKPHLPLVAPKKYWDYYQREDFSIAPFQAHPKNEVSYSWNNAKELRKFRDIPNLNPISETKQKEVLHGYYACVSFIDVQVGRLLTELENLELHTNTVVVIWGDHGFQLGEHSEWVKHSNMEGASRVPFIIYSPFTGIPGAKTQSPATAMDFYPTMCALAGLPIPQQPLNQNESPFAAASGRALKGKNLIPVMNNPEVSVRTGAVNLFTRDGVNGYAYRTTRYCYTEWILSTGVVDARELYDFKLDPLQTVNLAGEQGFDALMYQFSRSMRKEFNDIKMSVNDLAADRLQGSPAASAPTNRILPAVDVKVSGNTAELAWPDAAGSTYNIRFKTNLLDAVWSIEKAGVSGSPCVLPTDNPKSFYRIEVSN
jgi:iduronate 2-sulfatase